VKRYPSSWQKRITWGSRNSL